MKVACRVWLLLLTCCREYRPKPHLDRYEGRDLDEREYEPMAADARANAEAVLAERDRAAALARGRVPMALREEVRSLPSLSLRGR